MGGEGVVSSLECSRVFVMISTALFHWNICVWTTCTSRQFPQSLSFGAYWVQYRSFECIAVYRCYESLLHTAVCEVNTLTVHCCLFRKQVLIDDEASSNGGSSSEATAPPTDTQNAQALHPQSHNTVI